MSQSEEGAPAKRLTADDPVERDVLEQLRELQESRSRIADNLLDLEQSKIQLLASAKRVDDQRGRIFQAILVSRGLSPALSVEIDARSGKLILDDPPPSPSPPSAQG